MQKKLLILTLLVLSLSTTVLADTWTSSIIATNTTWLKNNTTGDGVYVVDVTNDTLIVASGVTLTIEPGVTVKFHDDVKFLVYGTLLAEGTAQDSIKFILDDAPGSASEWGSINLLSTDSTFTNLLSYCLVEDADADGIGLGASEDSKNGGGIYFGSNIRSNTELNHCTIQNNHAYEGGGGISFAGSPVVTGCLIRNNSADQYGGGVSIKGPTPTTFANPQLANNIIIHNSANGSGGGGVGLLSGAILDMTHNLIGKNSAPNGAGGGIYLSTGTTAANIANSIIGENTADSDPQVSGTINISYSDIEGGYTGTGNIDEDPAFLDPDNDDYHFGATSHLVDAANNDSSIPVDFEGTARPFDGDRNQVATSDMGPYEYVNTAPQITSTPVTEATEDSPYSYQVEVDDPDLGESLTFSLTEAPAFLSINAATGEVSGMPDNDAQAGDHNVTVQVADLNGATDDQNYTLTVTAVNDQPVVSGIPDQSILEGQTFTTINLDNYVTDEESPADEFTWAYSGNLQLSVSIVNRIATISMSDTNWYGSETITFTGTDPGGLSDDDAAVFTVTNINDAPVISDIPDQTINEGGTFTQINLDNYVSDIDNVESDLNWVASGNSDLEVTINADRVATITTPNEDWFGSETITFTVKDPGGLEDSDAAVFTVLAVNDAPVVSDIPDQTVMEGQSFVSFDLDTLVSDVEDPDDQLSWTYNGNIDLTVSIDAEHIVTITIPDSNWNGSEEITFTATDTSGDSGADAASFTVTNINDAPVVSQIPDQTIDEGDTFAVINLNEYVADEDDADETINWQVSGDEELMVSIDENNQATIEAPHSDWFGTETLIFVASDPLGLADSAAVDFTVTPVNDAPLISTIPNQTVSEGQSFNAIPLDDYVLDVDDADSTLAWDAAYYTNMSVVIEDRVLTVSMLDPEWNGSSMVTLYVSDPAGLKDSADVIFTVTPVNDSTQFISVLPELTFAEDDSLVYAISNWYPFVEDKDNEDSTLTFVAYSGKSVTTNLKTKAYIFKAGENWFGLDTLLLTASDGEFTDSAYFQVTVEPVNDTPQIVGLPQLVMFTNDTNYVLNMFTYMRDVDTPDSLLNWTISEDEDSLLVNYTADTGKLIISVIPNFTGTVEMVCMLSDDSQATVKDTISIEVTSATAIEDLIADQLPTEFKLNQNYPNPFNPSTTISYQLKALSDVELTVYNVLGQKIATMVQDKQRAGYYRYTWDGATFANGVYFYRIQAGKFTQVRKMILMK